jgi:hypothetical protein
MSTKKYVFDAETVFFYAELMWRKTQVICGMEWWSGGVMECWGLGMMDVFQYSELHYSITPVLHFFLFTESGLGGATNR